MSQVYAATATTTTLALSASTVPAGTVVTFTATVSGSVPVTPGQVVFCDASATYCNDAALIGKAMLNAAGTASLRLVPGKGIHNYKAVFKATATYAGSTSATQTLTVTGTNATTTTLSSSGSAGAYTLTAAVMASGSGTLSGAVNLSFIDDTISYTVASSTSGVATPAQVFQAQSLLAAGNGPSYMAAGDFNNDGYLDLVVANSTGNTLSVFLGNGDGSFRSQVSYAVGSSPSAVGVSDFNGDGRLDLVAVNYGGNTVSILIGNGNGTFQAQVTYAVGHSPQSVAIGDFTSDGKIDLVVDNRGDGTLSVLLGNGNGTFASQVVVGLTTNAYEVTVADYNADGHDDLSLANYGAATVTVQLENGMGGITSQTNCNVGANPEFIAVGDFNGDGKLDLAVANSGSNTVSILLGKGNGTFLTQVTYAVGTGPNFIAVGDFNGDGKSDLAVANPGSSSVSILLGKGDGTFQSQIVYSAGTNPIALVIADFNGDGKQDLAVANQGSNDVSVMLTSVMQTVTFIKTGVNLPGTGTHQVEAVYAGDGTFLPSTSNTLSLTAMPATTSLALTASPSPGTVKSAVILTATLNPAIAGILSTNGETVTFKEGAAVLGTGTLSGGVASLSVATFAVGTHSLTASYGGDTNFLASAGAMTLTMNKITPVITWPAPASIVYGTALSGTQLNATSNGVTGSFAYAPAAGLILPAGANALAATFTPTDTTNYATVVANNTITVTRAATAIVLTTTSAAPQYGSMVTLTATLPLAATGIVTFYDGATALGSASLIAGTAALSTNTLGGGTHSVTASWPGDSNYQAAASNTVTETVAKSAVTVTIASSRNPSIYGDALVLTLTFTGTGVIPSGTAVLQDGGATLATLTLDASGAATYALQNPVAGTHNLQASYNGDNNYY